MPPFLPIAIRLGQQVLPILLNEVAKPRFRKFVRKGVDFALETALKKGKGSLRRTGKPKQEFIMRRGRQRFQCRKVK